MSSTHQNTPQDSKPATRATRHLAEPAAPEAVRKGRLAKLFEVNAKPADGSVLPVAPRRPQRSWRLWGLALLAVACGLFWMARAQPQPDTPEQTTEPMPAEDTSPAATSMADTEDATQSNQPAASEEITGTNNAAPADGSSSTSTNATTRRSRRSYRRRSGTGNSSATYGSLGGDQSANGRAGFTNFNVILKNNIFDPLRHPGYVRSGPAPVVHEVQTFTLRGTASLGSDNLAVFDGTRSEFHKAARVADTIAVYKVAAVTPDLVKLAAGTNEVELRVGMQMRREDEGPWTRSDSASSYASAASVASGASSGSSTNLDSALSGPEGDILKKLMKQREQE
jgi:hypothetical protein